MGRGILKAFLGLTAFLAFTWFLFVGVIANGGTETVAATTALVSGASTLTNSMHFEPIQKHRPTIHPNLNPNFVSKRRVPNGPDPIHNRRAGKSRQPPGRA